MLFVQFWFNIVIMIKIFSSYVSILYVDYEILYFCLGKIFNSCLDTIWTFYYLFNSYYLQKKCLRNKLQQRRPSSARGDEISQLERFLEKPSVPLQAKGPPGPPRIVEIEEKYSAIEGKTIPRYVYRILIILTLW